MPLTTATRPGFDHAIIGEVRSIDTVHRRIEAYCNTGGMDRHGTVIEPKAVDKSMKEFMKNPIVRASHMASYSNAEPPVFARIVDWRKDDKGVIVTVEFARGGMADLWWSRYSEGFMRGLSIGFRVLARERRQREDKSGEFEVYTGIELVEISLVDIPSNRDALTLKCFEGDADAIAELIGSREAIETRAPAPAPAPGSAAAELAERVRVLEREVANLIERLEDSERDFRELRTRQRETRGLVDEISASPLRAAPSAPGATPGARSGGGLDGLLTG